MPRSPTQPRYAEDSDDTEPESTPKAATGRRVKRRSSVHVAYVDDDEEGPRVPLKSVNINDDAAEKRRRRKSTKIQALDTSEIDQDADSSRTMKQKQPLNAVAPPPPVMNFNVVSSKYEEWMKMATDNKFNATNSWQNELINYFHEMSLLRNDDDNSINFQRASCTLDGCVKIWTSRVDSVGTETAKLASNLASGGSMEDEDDADSDNPDEDGNPQPKKKKAHRPGATLAKDISALQSKKLDLEFSVDPLFRKTCADFDEGGASGLLMNHLSLGVGEDGYLAIVFDAGDSAAQDDDEEEDAEDPEEQVDLAYLRQEFLPDLSVLDDKAISHSLADFSFGSSDSSHRTQPLDADDAPATYDDVDDGPDFNMDVDGGGPPPVEDFFTGDNAVEFNYNAGPINYGGDDDSNASFGPGVADTQFVPFDPRRLPNDQELTLTMTDENTNSELMDHYDKSVTQNWAGPEHWKIRRPIRRVDADHKATKARREKKEPFKIDFHAETDKTLKKIADELFAPGKISINLPGTGSKSKKKKQDNEKKDDFTLPDDMHFSSRQLVCLFLKPKFSLQMRGRAHVNADDPDGNFWVNPDGNEDPNSDGGGLPFSTQFFDDDDDLPVFDYPSVGAGEPDEAGEQDLLASTQGQQRRVRPEFVNYAKRAKRVDVRKLKDNIWKGLDIVVEKQKEDDEEDMDVEDGPTPTDPTEARTFSSVISGLQSKYPAEKMEEISTSFCFICLLHLANEQGLKIQPDPEVAAADSSKDLEDKRIGNIWDLKVYRDPDAPQAA